MFVFDRRVNSKEYGDTVCAQCSYHFFNLKINAVGTSFMECCCCGKEYGGIGNASDQLVRPLLSIIGLKR